MGDEKEKSELTVVRGEQLPLGPVFGAGELVAIEQDEAFGQIVAKSVDREIVGPVVAEIQARREKLRIRHVLSCLLGLTLVGLFAYLVFPRVTVTRVEGKWNELMVVPKAYETDDSLRTSVSRLLDDPAPMPASATLSADDRKTVLKYRTLNIRKDPSDYALTADDYLSTMNKLANRYRGEFALKECFVEGVLKTFPESGRVAGLKEYARMLKTDGDQKLNARYDRVVRALDWCGDILHGLEADKADEAKVSSVKLQEAQLLMYRWLLEAARASTADKVKSFPDDKGDSGVMDRERAVELIRAKLRHVPEARQLHNQCIDILLEDDSSINKIYFDGESFWSRDKLKAKRLPE